METTKTGIMQERDDLRSKLSVELAKEDINVEEITDKLVAERMDAANEKFNDERDTLNGFLQSKINQNLQLEMQLDEIKDAYRALEASLSKDDKQFRQKVQMLERSVEQISSMYQNAVNERSILKVYLQVAERKHQKSAQRQQLLEKKYEQQRNKNNQMEKILIQLRKEVLDMRVSEEKDKSMGIVRNSAAGGRVAIQGGGGKRLVTPRNMQMSSQIEQKNGAPRGLQGGGGRHTIGTQ